MVLAALLTLCPSLVFDAASLLTSSLPPAPSWPTHFHPFSLLHLITVAALAIAMAGSCHLGLKWKGTPAERRLRLCWCIFTVIWNVAAMAFYLWPGNFDPIESLPIHICDLAVWIAPVALLTQRRWLRTLLYFFGIGLSTQAFVTPVVDGGVAGVRYWLFWIGHTQIVGSAIYDVGVLGYRPRFKDLLFAAASLIVYALAVTPINLVWGLNYGYIGNYTPERPTLIDRLGPWPFRLLPMFALALTVFTLAWAVWAIPAALRGRKVQPDNCPTEPPP